MAKQGGRPQGRGAARAAKGTTPRRATQSGGARKPKAKVVFDARPEPEEPRTFRLGAVPGATPGKWIDTWKRRMPHVTMELVSIDPGTQRTAIDELDAALIRLPLADDSLHLISLYDEVAVVVASAESHLMAVDRLTADDLVGEVLITPLDDVLGPLALPTESPRFAPLETTADAIATVATGVGIVVVPMSLARLHHRKDVDYRPLLAGPTSTVALAWPRERTTADIETFVGIVRGRTSNSSR
ncbi:MAG: LysR substrate-binding domain-containing protein [Microbacterium sp.]|uniref:LysR substrate-binding domain-containing protein n=1 Tax=Microbacterium sp. TaxID=51671 RepID=UPI003F975ADD